MPEDLELEHPGTATMSMTANAPVSDWLAEAQRLVSERGGSSIVLGAVQLLYGVLAMVTLVRRGAEFSRPCA